MSVQLPAHVTAYLKKYTPEQRDQIQSVRERKRREILLPATEKWYALRDDLRATGGNIPDTIHMTAAAPGAGASTYAVGLKRTNPGSLLLDDSMFHTDFVGHFNGIKDSEDVAEYAPFGMQELMDQQLTDKFADVAAETQFWRKGIMYVRDALYYEGLEHQLPMILATSANNPNIGNAIEINRAHGMRTRIHFLGTTKDVLLAANRDRIEKTGFYVADDDVLRKDRNVRANMQQYASHADSMVISLRTDKDSAHTIIAISDGSNHEASYPGKQIKLIEKFNAIYPDATVEFLMAEHLYHDGMRRKNGTASAVQKPGVR